MEKNQKYTIVVKQLENEKFLIKFPDFEGITTIAETEENIEKVASSILNLKIQELKGEKLELPNPRGIMEVQRTLEMGEFVLLVEPKNSNSTSKGTSINIDTDSIKEGVGKIYSKSENIIKDKIGNNIKEENYGLIGAVGGLLFALSSLLPIVGADIPFVGKFRIGFFTLNGIQEMLNSGFVAVNLSKQFFLVRFIVLLMVMNGIFTAYSAFKNKRFYFKSAVIMSVGLFVFSYLFTFIQLMRMPDKTGKFVGMSFAWLGLFIAIILIVISFILINKGEKKVTEEDSYE